MRTTCGDFCCIADEFLYLIYILILPKMYGSIIIQRLVTSGNNCFLNNNGEEKSKCIRLPGVWWASLQIQLKLGCLDILEMITDA